MKINDNDIRKYGAKQLTVDVQPPTMATNYEWVTGAARETEFDTQVQMGHLKISIYFKGKNRNSIIRDISAFMENLKNAADLELDGFKGRYRGYLTADDYEKKIAKNRYIINLEFDGYFYDDEITQIFDGTTTAKFAVAGTRDAPCVVEILAKNNLSNYTITGLGEDGITIESLAAGQTVVIDGILGLVTVSGKNAFDRVNLWEFPKLKTGRTELTFSSTKAVVTIRYKPMWI
ncbi:MAG: phage tail family protein [Lachnospiraceae bacterium]|nr:phage tail family protein [Lachnospiraceae bacterium]